MATKISELTSGGTEAAFGDLVPIVRGGANYKLPLEAVAAVRYAQTADELSASVTPTDYSFEPGNVKRYGAVGDNVTDDTAAFKAALSIGGEVRIPGGTYKITETLNLKKRVWMHGVDGGYDSDFPPKLVFSAGIPGLFLHRVDTNANSSGVPVIEASTTGADNSVLEHLSVLGGNEAADDASHGIWLKCRATLRDVGVQDFAGNGIHVRANAVSEDPLVRGNANLFTLIRCSTLSNGGHGLYINGADANAGETIAHNSTYNGGWGIYDSSFLGNTHISAHTAINTTGAYKTDSDSARNVFIGCYSESNQPASEFVAPTVILSGLHGAGMSGGLHINPTTTSITMPLIGNADANGQSVNIGGSANSFVNVGADGDDTTGLSLAYWNGTSGSWEVRHARLSSRIPVRYTTSLTVDQGGRGAAIPAGNVLFKHGIFLGADDDARRVQNGTAAPSTGGPYARGDVVFNRAPSAGGFVGWVCVTAGSPGTWKGFGAIEA